MTNCHHDICLHNICHGEICPGAQSPWKYEGERQSLVPFFVAPRVGLCPIWDLPGRWSIPNGMIRLPGWWARLGGFSRQTPEPVWPRRAGREFIKILLYLIYHMNLFPLHWLLPWEILITLWRDFLITLIAGISLTFMGLYNVEL